MDERKDMETSAEEVSPDDVLNGPPRPFLRFSWRDTDPWRAALVALASAALVASLVWGLSSILDSEESGTTGGGETSATLDHDAVDETTTPDVDGSGAGTPIRDADGDIEGDEGGGTVPDSPAFVDAGLVAYRMDDEVWVARQDGSDQRFVADLGVGAYSLSPDGGVLALVDAASMKLEIVDVESGERHEICEALVSAPVWSPDSRWMLIQRRGSAYPETWQVTIEGGELLRAAVGHGAHVIPDATGFAVVTRDHFGADDHAIRPLLAEGEPDTLVEMDDRVTDFAWNGRVLVHASQDDSGRSRIVAGTLEDPEQLTLVRPLEDVLFMVGYQQLTLSPDGSLLAYAAAGDDGYSRVFVVPVTGGTPMELTIRRDAYILRWSTDGRYLLFIEGNSFQGEETRLVRVRPDGTGRQTLIEGADL